jgi:hypothetical protein
MFPVYEFGEKTVLKTSLIATDWTFQNVHSLETSTQYECMKLNEL